MDETKEEKEKRRMQNQKSQRACRNYTSRMSRRWGKQKEGQSKVKVVWDREFSIFLLNAIGIWTDNTGTQFNIKPRIYKVPTLSEECRIGQHMDVGNVERMKIKSWWATTNSGFQCYIGPSVDDARTMETKFLKR